MGLAWNGQLFAYADPHTVRLFQLTIVAESGQVQITKLRMPVVATEEEEGEQQGLAATHIVFTKDSKHMVVATLTSDIHVFGVEDVNQVKHVGSFRHGEGVAAIQLLTVSDDGKWVAVASSDGHSAIYNSRSLHLHATLPTFEADHTVLQFLPKGDTLVVVCSNNKFFFYDIAKKALTAWSKEHAPQLQNKNSIIGVTVNPAMPDYVVFYSEDALVHVHRQQAPPQDGPLWTGGLNYQEITGYGPIIQLDFLNDTEMVVIGRNPADVVAQLPPPIWKKLFNAA